MPEDVALVHQEDGDELYLIHLPQDLPGFDRFLGAWLLVTSAAAYLVDPGPGVSVPRLIANLEALGVRRLDYVLLTHIHLDHAGGTARLLERYSEAKVFAHPRGRPHLLAPEALWKGSQKVMGEMAHYYGPPLPLSPENLAEEVSDVEVIETPGHAPHHVCYRRGKILFAGEAAGVYREAGGLYLRPATPPRFFFDLAVESLDRLLSLDLENALICHGHYGANWGAAEIIRLHRSQLFLWREVAAEALSREPEEKAWYEFTRTALLARDPLLARFSFLSPEVQRREEYFLDNSLEGFRGDLLEGRAGPSGA
jgi:glyoxylase-like metal-dependent hydrolase (beta-lactamase superfamily II)